MSLGRVGTVAVGLAVDRLLGEPPDRVHPVAYLGSGLKALERRTYVDTKAAGVGHVALAVSGAAVVAGIGQRLLGSPIALTVSVAGAAAGKMLGDIATSVGDHLARDDLRQARRVIPALVGRDPDELNATDIARATVESVAENSVDAVIATAFWGLAAGPTGVWVHRTVNTLDAMIGHRSDRYSRFGWAAARLDDAMNWIPARIAALATALAKPSRAGETLITVRRDGDNHPSPNGGVVEAAFAGALDVTLGGTNSYGGRVELRGPLGQGPAPTATTISEAVNLARRTTWTSLAIMATAKILADRVCRR